MSEVRAVFFDFDGVLIDSEPIHYAAWIAALKPLGVSISEELYLERFTGIEDRAAIAWLASAQEPPRSFDELWATFPRKQKIFLDRILAEPRMPRDTCRVLEELKVHGYTVAVVSSSSSCELWPALERNGVRHLIDVGVFAEDVTQKKPHPEPYLTALRMAGVDRALVLEDSKAGIASATAAGCEVIPVTDVGEVGSLVRERLGIERIEVAEPGSGA
jgi:beta-phosphoglucomutase